MSVLIILLIVSIGIAGMFLLAYIWSVRNGQFDDEYGPPRRILFRDTTRRGSEQNQAHPNDMKTGEPETSGQYHSQITTTFNITDKKL
jgi:cbb3-type cytochrome oxidase maturation protein